MTATLYLNVSTYPLPYGSTAKMFVDIYKASDFHNDPSGSSAPPGASPDSWSFVTVAFHGTAVSLAGLDNTKAYWLRVFNPQGYSHWFPVSWSKGNSSGAGAMQVSVPAIEGPVALPAPTPRGITAITSDDGSIAVTGRTGPTTDLSVNSPPSMGFFLAPGGFGGFGNIQTRPYYVELPGIALGVVNIGYSFGPFLSGSTFQPTVYLEANEGQGIALPHDAAYTASMVCWNLANGDYMWVVSQGDVYPAAGGPASHNILWNASAQSSSGSTFSYPGAGISSRQPVTAPAHGTYGVAFHLSSNVTLP